MAESRPIAPRWLHWLAVLLAVSTLLLIGLGGLVTSKEAGLAVPDWPTSFGYNMFLLPWDHWKMGGVFYEHSHRLFASYVGMVTIALMVGVWLKDPRRWMRRLAGVAFVLVVLQGVLGGLRVRLLIDEIGIFHGALAQLFFCLTCALAFFTSRTWSRLGQSGPGTMAHQRLQGLVLVTGIIFVQLMLGATMRHAHAGLAVPDFPLAYGRIWPPMDAEFINQINVERMAVVAYEPVTAFQVGLHMTHRLWAMVVLLGVGACAWHHRRSECTLLRVGSRVWFGAVCLQGLLGAGTIWSNKAADVATLHVVLGALLLSAGALLTLAGARHNYRPAEPIAGAADKSSPGHGDLTQISAQSVA